jgi:hypothetical protein
LHGKSPAEAKLESSLAQGYELAEGSADLCREKGLDRGLRRLSRERANHRRRRRGKSAEQAAAPEEDRPVRAAGSDLEGTCFLGERDDLENLQKVHVL